MTKYYNDLSRTFSEFLLLPNFTSKDCSPNKICLKTSVSRYCKNDPLRFEINLPVVSAIMQAVSDDNIAISLAKCGGMAFIFCSQSIEEQAKMVRKVKSYKAGFVVSDSNLTIEHTLADVIKLKEKTNHSTIAITEDGKSTGKLLGIVTKRDYRLSKMSLDTKIKDIMTPFSSMICGENGISLSEANDILWKHKLNCLPIIDSEQNLAYLVFRKDYENHKENPNELLDAGKRYVVGAGINTYDYKERVPALINEGADILCIDSSDGFSEWQRETIQYIKNNISRDIKVGAGNVVDAEGFLFLAEAGADFVKVGIGGGSICITREQKGIGRGQASALMEVVDARDKYYKNTGVYIPICSDGGIVHDYHLSLALAMGADFIMLGRYFARFDESPSRKLKVGNNYVKEYWGEGSNRAKNWQRYDSVPEEKKIGFEEGVDAYVPYAGKLKDNLEITLSKIKATMISCGSANLAEFREKSRFVIVSPTSIVEGGAHDVERKEN